MSLLESYIASKGWVLKAQDRAINIFVYTFKTACFSSIFIFSLMFSWGLFLAHPTWMAAISSLLPGSVSTTLIASICPYLLLIPLVYGCRKLLNYLCLKEQAPTYRNTITYPLMNIRLYGAVGSVCLLVPALQFLYLPGLSPATYSFVHMGTSGWNLLLNLKMAGISMLYGPMFFPIIFTCVYFFVRQTPLLKFILCTHQWRHATRLYLGLFSATLTDKERRDYLEKPCASATLGSELILSNSGDDVVMLTYTPPMDSRRHLKKKEPLWASVSAYQCKLSVDYCRSQGNLPNEALLAKLESIASLLYQDNQSTYNLEAEGRLLGHSERRENAAPLPPFRRNPADVIRAEKTAKVKLMQASDAVRSLEPDIVRQLGVDLSQIINQRPVPDEETIRSTFAQLKHVWVKSGSVKAYCKIKAYLTALQSLESQQMTPYLKWIFQDLQVKAQEIINNYHVRIQNLSSEPGQHLNGLQGQIERPQDGNRAVIQITSPGDFVRQNKAIRYENLTLVKATDSITSRDLTSS